MKKSIYAISSALLLALAMGAGCSHRRPANDETMNSAPTTSQAATDVGTNPVPSETMDNNGNLNPTTAPYDNTTVGNNSYSTDNTGTRVASLGAGSSGLSH